jgi:hypothetical protein
MALRLQIPDFRSGANQMESEQIISEFQNLRLLLNQSNRIANEETKFLFEIRRTSLSEYRMFASVKNKSEEHRVAVAKRDKSRTWERSGYTKCSNLENFCALELNNAENKFDFKYRLFYLSDPQIESLTNTINSIFSSLLIEKL